MFQKGQLKSLAVATALIIFNIAVMWIFAFTPLSAINNLLFGTFFLLGVLVYGAMLTGGVHLAKKGVKDQDSRKAIAGVSLIQLAYGMFGAGILSSFLSPKMQLLALVITGIVTSLIAVLSGLLVFGTNHDFSSWGKYANYIFLGVIAVSFIGSFSPALTILAFALALIGFIVYLIHEIYITKIRPRTPFLNGIGLYTAYMGVFVEILQIVAQMLLGEE